MHWNVYDGARPAVMLSSINIRNTTFVRTRFPLILPKWRIPTSWGAGVDRCVWRICAVMSFTRISVRLLYEVYVDGVLRYRRYCDKNENVLHYNICFDNMIWIPSHPIFFFFYLSAEYNWHFYSTIVGWDYYRWRI